MVQLHATKCSYIAVLWVSLVSFVAITLCVAPQRVFVVVVYFVIHSVRKRLDTHSYAAIESFSIFMAHYGCWSVCPRRWLPNTLNKLIYCFNK